MEHRIVQPFPEAHIFAEADREQDCARAFKDRGADQNLFDKGNGAGDGSLAGRLNDHFPLIEPDMPPERHHRERHDRHKADPPHLYEEKNDDLPEQRPVRKRIVYHKPRDAGRRRGGEKRVEIICPGSLAGSKRERQKKSARQDDHEVTEHEKLPCGQLPFSVFHHIR